MDLTSLYMEPTYNIFAGSYHLMIIWDPNHFTGFFSNSLTLVMDLHIFFHILRYYSESRFKHRSLELNTPTVWYLFRWFYWHYCSLTLSLYFDNRAEMALMWLQMLQKNWKLHLKLVSSKTTSACIGTQISINFVRFILTLKARSLDTRNGQVPVCLLLLDVRIVRIELVH